MHQIDLATQYCSRDYRKALHKRGFKVLMSGDGNCSDFTAGQLFFGTTTTDGNWQRSCEAQRQAKIAIFEKGSIARDATFQRRVSKSRAPCGTLGRHESKARP
jgi:hypothetical protein